MTKKRQPEEERDYLLSTLKDIEQRLALLENLLGHISKPCKVCETEIDIRSTSREALLAELCDQCYEMQNSEMP